MRRTLANFILLNTILLQRVAPLRTVNTLRHRQSIDTLLVKASIIQWHSQSTKTSSIRLAAEQRKYAEFVSDTLDPSSQRISSIILESVGKLCNSGSDIRGRFVDHSETVTSLVKAIQESSMASSQPSLSPFAAYCIGHSFADAVLQSMPTVSNFTVCIGVDPREHGVRLANAFACGVKSYSMSEKSKFRMINTVFTGAATTPACASFVRLKLCDCAVMVTASHLPRDRNGFKLFSAAAPSGFSKPQVQTLGEFANSIALTTLEQSSFQQFTSSFVEPSLRVNWMPIYSDTLKEAILLQTRGIVQNDQKPLTGLKIVLNSGNGAGDFFQTVLDSLGADVSGSINLTPDGSFPNGIPNPEDLTMLEQTISACEREQADLGIMLDTDADRCGFVVPRMVDSTSAVRSGYEPLNRNRLIALLAVIFAKEKPGCAVVTDSVTSEGLSMFLTEKLGLKHIRYLKGYANVIGKAKELTESGEVDAELAIETSGHCAMRENGYLDDGTYTAVKIVSLLAQQRALNLSTDQSSNLLDLIADMSELKEVCELRMVTTDSKLETMQDIFNICILEIENFCNSNETWQIDRENLEGIRLRFGKEGEFFMLRKSLHDPIISLQIEAQSKRQAREMIVDPLLKLLSSNDKILNALNVGVLSTY